MGIFNFFERFRKRAPQIKKGEEIDRFLMEKKVELQDIKNFLERLYHYQNPETLLMTLKEFMTYLEEQKKPMQENINIEKDTEKIKDLYNKLTDIDLIISFINTYISYSKSELYDLPEISKEQTTLLTFVGIIQEREIKIEELLNLNDKK